MRDTSACQNCIVTFLVERPEGALVLDIEHQRALRTLHDAGLAPANHYQPVSPEARPA
jgi:hypothetical protein